MFASIDWAIGPIGIIFYILQTVIILSWVLLLGLTLYKLDKRVNMVRYQVFVVTCVTLILVICVLPALLTWEEIAEMTKNLYVVIIYAAYSIVSLFIIFSFPARILKSIEINDRVNINDYFGDTFLFMFWPIGIWFIQPRLNKIGKLKMVNQQ